MQLKKVNKLPPRATYSENYYLVNEFSESDMDCAEIVGAETRYSTAAVAANTFKATIKNYKIPGVHAVSRGGKTYLIKIDKEMK